MFSLCSLLIKPTKYFSNLFIQTPVVLPFLPDEDVLHPRPAPAAHLPLVETVQNIHPGGRHHLVTGLLSGLDIL